MMFDQVISVIELIMTAIGLILVVFGWIIPHRQSIKHANKQMKYEEEVRRLQWEKDLLDEQISKLYGPLAELIEEQNIRWRLILYQIGKNHIFDKDTIMLSQLPDDVQKIWVHFVDVYKIPIQNKMVEILLQNQHLIYKSEKPTCYKSFIEYALGWEMLDNQKKNGVPNFYEYYYRYNYPIEFDNYVIRTLKELQRRQGELVELQHTESTAF